MFLYVHLHYWFMFKFSIEKFEEPSTIFETYINIFKKYHKTKRYLRCFILLYVPIPKYIGQRKTIFMRSIGDVLLKHQTKIGRFDYNFGINCNQNPAPQVFLCHISQFNQVLISGNFVKLKIDHNKLYPEINLFIYNPR